MEFNENIIDILSYIHKLGNFEINNYLKMTLNQAILLSNNKELFQISKESMAVCGSSIQDKIILRFKKGSDTISLDTLKKFLDEISKNILGLNHLGIGYSCKDPYEEIKKYATKAATSNFKIYEEQANNKFLKWYFLANLKDIKAPIFEIVLTKSNLPLVDNWNPHFQIDIDTNLDSDTLKNKVFEIFGTNFDWALETADLGMIVGMKILGNINGTKICIGVSTKLRDFKFHREKLLKEVN